MHNIINLINNIDMNKKSFFSDKQEEFIDYLIEKQQSPGSAMPSISAISSELGISTACLREQMELARNLGLITTQPRKGIEIQPYSFTPAVIKSLYYAIKTDQSYFEQFSELRNHLERSFFIEAARALTAEDLEELAQLTRTAHEKLQGNPIQLPHEEHRRYHLMIYKGLRNTFLDGLLEAYWDTYELVGLDVYMDLAYHESVWKYHETIIQNLQIGDFDAAYQLLLDHMELIYQR
jgi:GntR family transcriptional repressor for pyruvate dehydrogenase complex